MRYNIQQTIQQSLYIYIQCHKNQLQNNIYYQFNTVAYHKFKKPSQKQMKIDQKPRQFTYINHKDNSPLQLKGTMKARSRPQSSNHYLKNNTSVTNIIGNNQILIDKIKDGYQDLKSIVPIDYSERKRRQSIKTYDKQKYVQVSGAALLMVKSKIEKDHPEKKHLTQRDVCQNINSNSKSGIKEKRHYPNLSKQKQNKIQQGKDVPRKHSETLYKKIDNDLYSRLEFKENMINPTVKMSEKNMFKAGVDLGYENIKNHKLTQAKKRELIGSNMLAKPEPPRNFRNDWIKSSFTLG